MKKNKIKLFVTLSFALLMAFGNVNSVSAAKSTTKSTPYGTLKGFISPYNSGSSKLCEGGTTIGQNVKSIKIKIEAKKTSTGANIGSTQNQHANVGDMLELKLHFMEHMMLFIQLDIMFIHLHNIKLI